MISMDAVIFSFTRQGIRCSHAVRLALQKWQYHVTIYGVEKYITPQDKGVQPLQDSLRDTVGKAFSSAQCLIFIGAAGIAVRSIAPYLQSKKTDPAVVVVDEKGEYIIPLLSGHIGGANNLAVLLARALKGQAVLTTATDVNHVFAVDEWAARHGLVIASMDDAKAFAAAIVEQKKAGFCSDFPIEGALPPSLYAAKTGTVGVALSLRADTHPFTTTVVVQPKIFHLGIGCRAGITAGAVSDAVDQALTDMGILKDAVVAVHSIDLKRYEEGIIAFCKSRQIPFTTFSAAKLAALPGRFTASSFVLRTVGVDNVCERAAVCGSHGGTLIMRKTAYEGVTLAMAYERYNVSFTMKE